jgi:hypothetical protein
VTSATVFLPRTLTEWAVNAYNSGGRTSDWSAVLAIINRVPGPPPKPHRK